MGKAKHLIVISEDAMVYEDLAELRQMPSFGQVMKNAAIVKTVRSVYPTITYPNHTSMRTGTPNMSAAMRPHSRLLAPPPMRVSPRTGRPFSPRISPVMFRACITPSYTARATWRRSW